MQLLNKKMLY